MNDQDKDALQLCEDWTANYALDRTPHELHALWSGGAPPACPLALKAAIAHIRRLVQENEELREKLEDAEENVALLGQVAQAHIELLAEREKDREAMREALEAFRFDDLPLNQQNVDKWDQARSAAISALTERVGEV